jgi:hypothetical protein
MLPKLATPKYDMIVPSTGKSITYRPYVVKEEKILLIAMESQNDEAIESAIIDIIKLCIETPIKVDQLTNFDTEFIFVTLRSKSVGEGIKIAPKCKSCEEENETKIDLEKVRVKNLEDAIDKHVKLTDDISIDLNWPTMKDKLTQAERKTGTDTIINMAAKCIDIIYSGEEVFAAKDSSMKERVAFIESLNTDQFAKIIEVISNAPVLTYDVEYKCKKCGEANTIELKGLADFFQ